MNILLSNIKIDEKRQREDLDETSLTELTESMRNNGQITPIVIDREHKLIAGRRRIEAARRLGWSEIRAEYFDSLDILAQKIIEFDDNDKRKQLTWQESACAIKEIHDLKREKEGREWS